MNLANRYKQKYLQLKRQLSEPENESQYHEDKEIDFYLFIDLLQIANRILKITSEKDTLILIGDTHTVIS